MTHRDVVLIGASAGGVEAVRALLAALPESFPAAVLVVLHVAPHSPHMLDDVLGRRSRLPVRVAEDGEPIAAGRVYLPQTDRHLLLDGDRLRVTRGPKENRVRPAIDAMFRSAAYSIGPRAIGVVLTGMLDDGTAGLWAVKDRGGLAIVQSPGDAAYDSMPESALRHVAVDYAVTLAGLPSLLERATSDAVPDVVTPAPSRRMEVEARVAREDGALAMGVLNLGEMSPNTCPECHGAMVRLREGPIVRYRCHTGHAFSSLTLLADIDESIEATLWNALRVLEERVLVLNQLAASAEAGGDEAAAARYRSEAAASDQECWRVREMALNHRNFGRSRSQIAERPRARVD